MGKKRIKRFRSASVLLAGHPAQRYSLAMMPFRLARWEVDTRRIFKTIRMRRERHGHDIIAPVVSINERQIVRSVLNPRIAVKHFVPFQQVAPQRRSGAAVVGPDRRHTGRNTFDTCNQSPIEKRFSIEFLVEHRVEIVGQLLY